MTRGIFIGLIFSREVLSSSISTVNTSLSGKLIFLPRPSCIFSSVNIILCARARVFVCVCVCVHARVFVKFFMDQAVFFSVWVYKKRTIKCSILLCFHKHFPNNERKPAGGNIFMLYTCSCQPAASLRCPFHMPQNIKAA